MGTILALVEQREGHLRKSAAEVIGEAARVGAALGFEVAAGLCGSGIAALGEGLGEMGAGTCYQVDSDALADYSTEGYTSACEAIVKESGATVVFMAASAMGKDLGPRLAERLKAGVASDIVATSVEEGKLTVKRPIYAGKLIATVGFESPIAMATLRPNVFETAEGSGSATVKSVAMPETTIRARVKETVRSASTRAELTEADIVVSGGRGIGSKDNYALVEELANALGAAAGASRAIVDAEFVDHQFQVGQTGKTVSPSLYVAVGISGAIQHLAGMSSSKVIVAINKDPDAPIFKIADYGVVGDLFQVVPPLVEEIKKVRMAE